MQVFNWFYVFVIQKGIPSHVKCKWKKKEGKYKETFKHESVVVESKNLQVNRTE